ncbi:MAG TPA: GNAT family N-acetyltransferase [Bacteroidales bacterium]|nr:MAG: hypothetical protein A2X11_16070 [Bacteroidetes bacterium GWE2_42_24]OFY29213.1 MAG: hypothetical protein A2X09_05770 [Bacteroidetes bacterium GWF2_43_11]HAQ65503.1 GNAT family N-acetyltransferase [Bacteroidales bacterium]HBZ66805.1 GNAT family N-acetyltransferase [Bacteroidales bacterium]
MKILTNDVVIKTMNLSDMQTALDWADSEGWNPGLHDAEAFYYSDPNGFFIATINEKPAGIISAVAHDDKYGFIGFFIVKPEYRGTSLAMLLGKTAFAHLGNRNIGLDGVPARLENYRAFGFTVAHQNTRYTGIASGSSDPRSIPLYDIPFDQLLSYDSKISGFNRRIFLSHWINQPGSHALAWPDKEGNPIGYGVIRPCRMGYKIGPLFACNDQIARVLFDNLCHRVKGEQVYLDVPEPNACSTEMAHEAGMTPVFSTARMYSKYSHVTEEKSVYGITSFELG